MRIFESPRNLPFDHRSLRMGYFEFLDLYDI